LGRGARVTSGASRWTRLVAAMTAVDGAELTVARMCSSASDLLLAVPGTSIVLTTPDSPLGFH